MSRISGKNQVTLPVKILSAGGRRDRRIRGLSDTWHVSAGLPYEGAGKVADLVLDASVLIGFFHAGDANHRTCVAALRQASEDDPCAGHRLRRSSWSPQRRRPGPDRCLLRAPRYRSSSRDSESCPSGCAPSRIWIDQPGRSRRIGCRYGDGTGLRLSHLRPRSGRRKPAGTLHTLGLRTFEPLWLVPEQ